MKLDSDRGTHGGDRTLHGVHQPTRRTSDSHDERDVWSRVVMLSDGKKPDGDEVFPQLVIFRVFHQADDLEQRFGLAGLCLQVERVAHWISARKILAPEYFVHNRDLRRAE